MNTKTYKFYNKFAPFYPAVDFILRPQKRILFNEINKLPAGKLLDIGIGTGSNLAHYKKHVVTGIDSSTAMLLHAHRKNKINAQLLQMDGEAMTFADGSFDYVVLSHVLAVTEDLDNMLKEVHRVLKPGGNVLILNHFTPRNWLGTIDRSMQFIGRAFHFRSAFYVKDLNAVGMFLPIQEQNIGFMSYFKLLVYQKH